MADETFCKQFVLPDDLDQGKCGYYQQQALGEIGRLIAGAAMERPTVVKVDYEAIPQHGGSYCPSTMHRYIVRLTAVHTERVTMYEPPPVPISFFDRVRKMNPSEECRNVWQRFKRWYRNEMDEIWKDLGY